MKKKLAAFLIISTTIFLTSCSTTKEKRYDTEIFNLFDTIITIVGYAENQKEFDNDVSLIHDQLEEYDKLYDIYHTYKAINNIKTINDNAGKAPVKVDQKIIDLLKESKNAYTLTDGNVNIAFGAVLSVWHQYRTEGLSNPEDAKLPPMSLLKEKALHTDIGKMVINEADSTVYLTDPQMSLDVGATAKGYVTEMICKYAKQIGLRSCSISLGGNVKVIGSKPNGKNHEELWNVGIQNPDLDSKNSILYMLSLKDYSVVTSGVYERFYIVNGKSYHHIIDPDTLMPSQYFLSVSIICRDSGMADVLSTAIFNMPYEEGLKLIESLKDTQAMWVFKDGAIKYSPGFVDFIKE